LISEEYMVLGETVFGDPQYVCRVCAPPPVKRPVLDTPKYGVLPVLEVYPYGDRFMAKCGAGYNPKTFFVSEEEYKTLSAELKAWGEG